MNEQNLSLNIGGIKCDNPTCDFKDDSVKVEEYPQWLNKPCEKCGENLLTQEDYDQTHFVIGMVNALNEMNPNDFEALVKKVDPDILKGVAEEIDKKAIENEDGTFTLKMSTDGKGNLDIIE